jgi:DNA-binding response OmpR family regulator
MKNVLLIDDDENIYYAVSMVLQKPTYKIVYKKNTRDAYHFLLKEKENIDIVLLDLMMPSGPGLPFLKKLRRDSIDVPVIVLSALRTAKPAVDAMKAGAADYITKPFDTKELRDKVKEHLAKRS